MVLPLMPVRQGDLHVHERRVRIALERLTVVSADGTSLTATATGFDSQLRRFEVTTGWDRVQAPVATRP
jgi:hypothetical protein